MKHAHLVKALAKPDEQLRREIQPGDLNLLHAALGLCGEAGEIIDTVKKAIIYRQPLDKANLLEELGDLEFFLELLRQATGLERAATLRANIAKLKRRYPHLRYRNQDAQRRADKQP